MKIFREIIIWFFEKYALDFWAEKQVEKEKQRIMQKNNLKTEEDFYKWHIEKIREPQREAYYAGREEGIEKLLNK